MKTIIRTLMFACAATVGFSITSCEDMLTKDSEYYLYADDNHLTSAADTVNSVLGIINKLQNIAVRTNLLGEVRADLVDITSVADISLRELSENNISDENKYNAPRDYYAVINNCNYFLANADSTLANVAKDTIFRKEIDAVRVYRAWTYLQLAMNYGSVPLVTEPLLTEAAAEEWETKPRSSLLDVCDYFINDLNVNYKSDEFPNYGRIDDHINPLLVFFPRLVVLGDLYLWRNALTGNVSDAKNAALCYYRWISNTTLPGRASNGYLRTRNYNRCYWSSSCFVDNEYLLRSYSSSHSSIGAYGAENITCIPMDSASSQTNFNQLRVLYNAREDNNYSAALVPSEALKDISKSQVYCGWLEDQELPVYPTREDILAYWDNDKYVGDLRYGSYVSLATLKRLGEEIEYQRVAKHPDPDATSQVSVGNSICIYRTGQLYMRLAEAMNAAGYPSFAQTILSWGLSDYSISKAVLPYCTTAADSSFIANFKFPNTTCIVIDYDNKTMDEATQIGIHSRGSGDTYHNEKYYHSLYADAPEFVFTYQMSAEDSAAILAEYEREGDGKAAIAEVYADMLELEQADYKKNVLKPYYQSVLAAEQNKVDSLIQIEWALEEFFEGTRFYNLMRADYRYRTQNIGIPYPLATAVGRRNPGVGERLRNENNWYINWKGKIGR